MKKFQTMAYVVALALVSTAGLSSCKSDEPGDGNYNGETVKTEFAINLPKQVADDNSGMSRMPSATVQKNGASQFQGITGIWLVPFAKQGAIIDSDARLGNNIHLTGDVTAADIAKPSKAKAYSNVSIPLSTASFLFYAKSGATGGTGTEPQKMFRVGALIPSDTASTNPSDFKFDLKQIQNSSSVSTMMAASNEGGKLMQYLTSVAIASDGAVTPKTPKRWYEYTANDDAALTAMFTTFTSMKGLSSFEVERVLTDLYKSLKPIYSSNALAKAISDSIATAQMGGTQFATVNGSDEVVLIASLKDFPTSYSLPEGSINIKWDGSAHRFVEGDYSNMARPYNYVYPAQLWYYVNSQIVTSNSSKQTMYDNTNNWATILAAHEGAISVNTRTRAVAINNPIQYAVARLDVQARLKAASLVDNSKTVEGVATDVDASAGFPISAIFVGGQQQVKFDFTANTAATEYTIYDNVMASTAEDVPADMMAMPSDDYSTMNHTLVLENGTGDVMVALEMTNTTGKDFYGEGGQLVPKNGKFYVVAQLTASAATETGGHVFKQDFITTAKLTLKDLKSAYNTLPDLRTPQLELGFSVDLTWQSGHTYELEF